MIIGMRENDVTKWTRTPRPVADPLKSTLDEHLGRLCDVLEVSGHRTYGVLELRIPGSQGSEVVYRWERA